MSKISFVNFSLIIFRGRYNLLKKSRYVFSRPARRHGMEERNEYTNRKLRKDISTKNATIRFYVPEIVFRSGENLSKT